MSGRADKIEKIIARMQKRIGEGQYYEAQQQTRVVAARHIKAENWSAAVDILYNVAQALLKSGQGGSGGDLCIFLMDVYKQAAYKPDTTNKGRLLTCLRLFDSEEPTRKTFISEIIGWSAKFGDFPAGDPELHHVVGSLYAEEHDPYEAERHLVTGTKDSAVILARLEYEWYKQDDVHTAPSYAARAILPYLLVANVRAANQCYAAFTDSLAADYPSLAVQNVSSTSADARIFPSLPLLNFLGLLLLAVQRGSPDLFQQLTNRYSSQLREADQWEEPLELIAEMYFGIQRPRKSNPLFDMMGSLFGGGGGGSNNSSSGRTPNRPSTKALDEPAAEGLD